MSPLALPLLLACGGVEVSGDSAPDDTDPVTDSRPDDSGTAPDSGDSGDPLEGLPMVHVQAGTYTIGSPTTEVGHLDDEAQHEVTLTRGFWIGVTEVTQAQFEDLLGYQPSTFAGCGDCPVETVDWHEAAAFANALSSRMGLEPCYDCTDSGPDVSCVFSGARADPYTCPGYRLPTEAEWEVAARAGTLTAYSSGGDLSEEDQWECDEETALVGTDGEVLSELGWYCQNSSGETHPVGRLEPNAWGLHDVHGNVSEWCGDAYRSYDGDETDPWEPSSSYVPVRRGGSWSGAPVHLRSAYRGRNHSEWTWSNLGFRVAKGEAAPPGPASAPVIESGSRSSKVVLGPQRAGERGPGGAHQAGVDHAVGHQGPCDHPGLGVSHPHQLEGGGLPAHVGERLPQCCQLVFEAEQEPGHVGPAALASQRGPSTGLQESRVAELTVLAAPGPHARSAVPGDGWPARTLGGPAPGGAEPPTRTGGPGADEVTGATAAAGRGPARGRGAAGWGAGARTTRKPWFWFRSSGCLVLRIAERQFRAVFL